MTLPGETIRTGAPSTCTTCHVKLELKVLYSGAGYYIGTHSDCGPYSRESGYYATVEEASSDMITGAFGRE